MWTTVEQEDATNLLWEDLEAHHRIANHSRAQIATGIPDHCHDRGKVLLAQEVCMEEAKAAN